MRSLKNILLSFVLLLVSTSTYAQELPNPVLYPFELFAKGAIIHPDPLPERLVRSSDKMELKDIPQKTPYRTVSYFDNGNLYTLHVLFGESEEGLSFEDYVKIRELLKELWKIYPNLEYNGRYHKSNKSWIWETSGFRIEWIYQNQPNSTDKKMGWLFFYSRQKFSENYNF